MHRDTVTRSWGPLLCHSSTTITSCCSMIMHGPMLQGSVHNSWKLKTSQFLHSQHTYRTCHPLSMFGMLWIGIYDSVFQFLPTSSNFTQPLKRSGPICHRPQSTTWSTPKSRMIIVKSIHFILQHKSLLYRSLNTEFTEIVSLTMSDFVLPLNFSSLLYSVWYSKPAPRLSPAPHPPSNQRTEGGLRAVT